MTAPPFRPPVLLLVAHWDDEVISAGGALLRFGRGWDVVCATKRPSVDRPSRFEHAFRRVCETCGATPYTLEISQRVIEPETFDTVRQAPRTVITPDTLSRQLENAVAIAMYQTVITHHPEGDVGRHPQHVQVSAAASRIFAGRTIYSFGEVAGRTADVVVALTEAEQARKQGLMNEYFTIARAANNLTWRPCREPLPSIERFSLR